MENIGNFKTVWHLMLRRYLHIGGNMNVNAGLDLVVILLLLTVSYIDFKTMEIPDQLNLAVGVCGIISAVYLQEISVVDRLAGAVLVSGTMVLLCYLVPDAFGGGDIKLVFTMGIYLGWKKLFTGVVLGFLFGGIQALYLLATGRVKLGENAHMPFGPALCTGLILSVMFGEELLNWYLGLFI